MLFSFPSFSYAWGSAFSSVSSLISLHLPLALWLLSSFIWLMRRAFLYIGPLFPPPTRGFFAFPCWFASGTPSSRPSFPLGLLFILCRKSLPLHPLLSVFAGLGCLNEWLSRQFRSAHAVCRSLAHLPPVASGVAWFWLGASSLGPTFTTSTLRSCLLLFALRPSYLHVGVLVWPRAPPPPVFPWTVARSPLYLFMTLDCYLLAPPTLHRTPFRFHPFSVRLCWARLVFPLLSRVALPFCATLPRLLLHAHFWCVGLVPVFFHRSVLLFPLRVFSARLHRAAA